MTVCVTCFCTPAMAAPEELLQDAISPHGIYRIRVRRHFVEQEIARMKQMPENRDRSRQIKNLEQELSILSGKPAV